MHPSDSELPHTGEPHDALTYRPEARNGNGYPMQAYPPAVMAPVGYPAAPYWSTPSTGESAKGMDAVTFLMALRRRWVLALLLGALTAGIASATVWHLWPPPGVGAQTILSVNPDQPHVLHPGILPTMDFNLYRKTQQVLVRSRAVIREALNSNPTPIDNLGIIKRLGGSAQGVLEGSMSADYDSAPTLLTVNLFSSDPQDANDLPPLLDAIIDSYIKNIVQMQRNGLTLKLDGLKATQDKLLDDISNKKETLATLGKELGSHDAHATQIRTENAWQKLRACEVRLETFQEQLQEKEIDLEFKQNAYSIQEKVPITIEEVEAIVSGDAEVMDLQKQYQEEEQILRETLKAVGNNKDDPNYKEQLDVVESKKKELDDLITKIRPDAEDELRRQRMGKLASEIEQLEGEIRALKVHEERYVQRINELVEETRGIDNSSFAMSEIRDEIAKAEENIAALAVQMDQIKIEMNAPDRVTRLEAAVSIAAGITKKQIMATWGAGAACFALVLFGVSWWEFRGRRINSMDEVIHGLGLRVVGALPALPDGQASRQAPRDASYPNYLIESVDTTRTMLLHAARRESLQTVMVTSARPVEGKTSLSIQLAASLARAGRKTLLVDADMRNPAVHQVFNLPGAPGLSELLRGDTDVPGTLQATSVRGLWVIPAGKWTAQATEALAQEAARPLLDQLKNEFDFIIVDSSPVLAVVDTLLVGQQVDAAIFSILHEVSHSPSVYAAHQRLESLGVRILGAVVNGVAASSPYTSYMDYEYGHRAYAESVEQAS
jgi:capsular exopolysaccharide synthesis family protein